MKFSSLFLICSLVFLFIGCKQSLIAERLHKADELEIVFVNKAIDAVTQNVKTDDKKAIRQIIDFIDSKESGPFKCGYDGRMVFRSKGESIQEVDFKFKDKNCRHFSFTMDDKEITTRLSNEAADFLASLETGKNYY